MMGAMGLLAGCTAGKPEAKLAPEVARGQAYFTTCQGCHGNAGEGMAGMKAPRLAGLPATYIVEQLMNYRKGVRGGATDFQGVQMNGRAKALPSDEAVKDVAAYIATLPVPAVETATAAEIKAGQPLYETCAACHGDKGQGNPAMSAPPLAGTDRVYLARQLRDFREGIRGRDGDTNGQQMRATVQMLPDDAAIDAVAAYASTLK